MPVSVHGETEDQPKSCSVSAQFPVSGDSATACAGVEIEVNSRANPRDEPDGLPVTDRRVVADERVRADRFAARNHRWSVNDTPLGNASFLAGPGLADRRRLDPALPLELMHPGQTGEGQRAHREAEVP